MSNNNKICVWGDSVAYGYHDIDNCGWVDRIKVALNYKDFTQIFNLGISADTSNDVLDRFDAEAKARRHDIIIFAIGINDTMKTNNKDMALVSIEDYTLNMNELVRKAIFLTKKVILIGFNPVDEVLASPVSWNKNHSFNNRRITEYNKVLEALAKKEKIDFIDIHSKFMEHEDYKKLLHDGAHPNSRGHELIFEEVKSLLWDKYLYQE